MLNVLKSMFSGPAIKHVAVPIPGAAHSESFSKNVSARHVHLDEAHPLLRSESRTQDAAPSLGKALLQQIGDLPATPMGRLLERVPAVPALVPVQLAVDYFKGAFASNQKLALTPSPTALGGYPGEPRGATFLPGGSDLPPPQRNQGYLADPGAMEPALTGRPEQRWTEPHEEIVPVTMKPSDFMHLSAEDDFWTSVRTFGRDVEYAKRKLRTVVAPNEVREEASWQVRQALSQLDVRGPNTLAGPIQKGVNSKGETTFVYSPDVSIMGTRFKFGNSALNGFNNYGVLGTYVSNRRTLTIDINARFPGWDILENYWGSGEAMMKALLRSTREEGIEAQRVFVRSSQLQAGTSVEWNRHINDAIAYRDRQKEKSLPYLDADQVVIRLLKNVDGMGAVLEEGYRALGIQYSPEKDSMVIYLERRGPDAP